MIKGVNNSEVEPQTVTTLKVVITDIENNINGNSNIDVKNQQEQLFVGGKRTARESIDSIDYNDYQQHSPMSEVTSGASTFGGDHDHDDDLDGSNSTTASTIDSRSVKRLKSMDSTSSKFSTTTAQLENLLMSDDSDSDNEEEDSVVDEFFNAFAENVGETGGIWKSENIWIYKYMEILIRDYFIGWKLKIVLLEFDITYQLSTIIKYVIEGERR